MLERILEIQGIGLFHNMNGKSFKFHKATCIYADNGRGKSTLASILRSVSSSDASIIENRRTVDGALQPRVVLQLKDGYKVTYQNASWSEQRPEFLVFDSEFIEKNVHSGGSVNTDHRKNLLEFALGESAVAARIAVNKATAESKKASEKLQSLGSQLTPLHQGIDFAGFESLAEVSDIDDQILGLEVQINSAKNLNLILSRKIPIEIELPTLNLDDVFGTLALSLEDVHKNAESLVRDHLENIGSDAEGWLNHGLQYIKDENCPYCAQKASGNSLLQAYRTFFDAKYTELLTKVSSLQESVSKKTASIVIEKFSQEVNMANMVIHAWLEQVDAKPVSYDIELSLKTLKQLETLLTSLVKQKELSPTKSFGTAADVTKANQLWLDILQKMEIVNNEIRVISNLIKKYKEKTTAVNIEVLKKQIEFLRLSKLRHQASTKTLIKEFVDCKKNVDILEKAKLSQRETLDKLMIDTLGKYELSINSLLSKFGAAFKISQMGANFRGASPRTEYGLELRGNSISLEGSSPSFSTALSEGDKRTLAFAFFIASTLDNAELGTRTVVIDDPMCSLDTNRRHHTQAVLKQIYLKSDQLIVLAHDPYFLRNLTNAIIKATNPTVVSVFQICQSENDYSEIKTLNLEIECESDYFKHHRLLNDFCAGKPSDLQNVAKAIRPMLEGYLNRRFPSFISKSLLFGEIVNAIRNSTPPSPLVFAKNITTELTEINDYVGPFHHDVNGEKETYSVTASALKPYVLRALHITHTGLPRT